MNIKYIIVSTIIGLTSVSTNFCMTPKEPAHITKKDQAKKAPSNPWLADINEEELNARCEYPYFGVFKAHNRQEFETLIKKVLNR